jgi:hypothetical protein
LLEICTFCRRERESARVPRFNIPITKAKVEEDRTGCSYLSMQKQKYIYIVFVYRREMSRVRLPAIVQLRMQSAEELGGGGGQ